MARRKILIFLVCLTSFFAISWIYYLARPAGLVVQQYGVSFSSKQALALGLNPYTTYLSILDELGVKKLRLVAYWDVIEPRPGKYNWRELDWQLSEANNRGAKVVLTIGRKLPRWPECFLPKWTNSLSAAEQENRLQMMLVEVIRRYENHPAVIMWQLENEPFVDWFGICFEPDAGVLSRERATIKYFSDKPILITDSGELSAWFSSANFADRFGTTLYRATWNPWFGYSFSPQ